MFLLILITHKKQIKQNKPCYITNKPKEFQTMLTNKT